MESLLWRTSNLGEYILKRVDHYEIPKAEKKRAELVIDDQRLLLSFRGNDPLKTVIIEQMMEKVGDCRYKLTPSSLVKDCQTKEEIEKKIRQFKSQVSAKLPTIWDEFFQQILSQINPIKVLYDWSLYQVEEHPQLLNLLSTDPYLKKHTLKAEGRHIVVNNQYYNGVRQKLAEAGFFLEKEL